MEKTAIAFLLATTAIVTIKATNRTLSVQEICSRSPAGVTILRPNSCVNWVRCPSSLDAQDYEEGSCVNGLYYNKDAGRCENMDDVICPYANTQMHSGNRCATEKDGTFLSNPDNCKGYVFCAKGKETYSSCPGELVFSPRKSACVYPQEYTCPTTAENSFASPICNSIPKNMNFADITDCRRYYQCDDDGKANLSQCPDGDALDYISMQCVPRAQAVCHPLAPELEPELDVCGAGPTVRVGYFPDDSSCSGYYICAKQADGNADRKPRHLKCQNGYFFDNATLSCRHRLNVNCPLDRCEGMDDKYVNVAGDCSSYARCSNGVTVNTGKCQNNYFFDERTQGCTPLNINYIACSAKISTGRTLDA